MRSPTVTDSATVSSSSMPARAATAKMSRARVRPNTVSDPDVGRIRPANVIDNAVRPDPAGQTSTVTPPAGTSRSTGP